MSDGRKLRHDLTSQAFADVLAEEHEAFFRAHPMDQLSQTAILEAPDGYEIIVCPWGDKSQRWLVLTMLRMEIERLKVQRYAFFSEVWMSVQDIKLGTEPVIRPSEDPNRVEQVFTVVCDRRLPEPVTVAQSIVRGRSGGVRKLLRVQRNDDEVSGIAGDLIDLFPRKAVQ